MQKQNILKVITVLFCIVFILIITISFLIFEFSEIKKEKNLPVNVTKYIEPVENNNNQEPVELETYQAELFIEAEWGEGEGEVGIYKSGGDEGGDGPVYGPQSFDVDDRTGYLYLLDSVNQRVIEYDENGKYLKDFPIACGGTGDVRVSPDGEFLYVFSWRCEAIYKYNIKGEFLESYFLSKEVSSGCLGTNGLAFDENENIMLDIEIEDYIKWGRFYQIGKNGDEWKENSYIGYILNNKKEYYLSDGERIYYTIKEINLQKNKEIERHILILNKEGLFQREIIIKFPKEVQMYFIGFDGENNFYADICYNNSYDEEIHKYDSEGNLLAVIDINKFLKIELEKINEKKKIYASYFKNFRVDENGNIYTFFTFKDEGLKLFKYSQVN